MTETMGLAGRLMMTDFEKVIMLIATLEQVKNKRGCWCRGLVMKGSHTRTCRDIGAAMRAAAYGMPEMETVKEGAD